MIFCKKCVKITLVTLLLLFVSSCKTTDTISYKEYTGGVPEYELYGVGDVVDFYIDNPDGSVNVGSFCCLDNPFSSSKWYLTVTECISPYWYSGLVRAIVKY